MITGPESAKQIERLGGLDFYPHNDKPALRELRVAGEQAFSSALLEAIVGEWLATETRAPKPAELRRLIHSAHTTHVKAKCKICDNSMWVTVRVLVTYRPGSYQMARCERLDLDLEASAEFAGKLAANQAILTAAKPCVCMSSEHKYLTGERD